MGKLLVPGDLVRRYGAGPDALAARVDSVGPDYVMLRYQDGSTNKVPVQLLRQEGSYLDFTHELVRKCIQCGHWRMGIPGATRLGYAVCPRCDRPETINPVFDYSRCVGYGCRCSLGKIRISDLYSSPTFPELKPGVLLCWENDQADIERFRVTRVRGTLVEALGPGGRPVYFNTRTQCPAGTWIEYGHLRGLCDECYDVLIDTRHKTTGANRVICKTCGLNQPVVPTYDYEPCSGPECYHHRGLVELPPMMVCKK